MTSGLVSHPRRLTPIAACLTAALLWPAAAAESAAFETKAAEAYAIEVLTGTVLYPHDVASIESLVAGIPGVVGVRSHVTAESDEPRPGPAAGYPDEWTPRY